MRAPFQVLVIPFRSVGTTYEFALLKRRQSTGGYWQPISGGGEDDESPLQAAKRETFEEAGISLAHTYFTLDSTCSIPVKNFKMTQWSHSIYVIPELCFAVDAGDTEISVSPEHTTFAWFGYEEAIEKVLWDSNKSALWELQLRLKNSDMKSASS